jgi:hypothetical protein
MCSRHICSVPVPHSLNDGQIFKIFDVKALSRVAIILRYQFKNVEVWYGPAIPQPQYPDLALLTVFYHSHSYSWEPSSFIFNLQYFLLLKHQVFSVQKFPHTFRRFMVTLFVVYAHYIPFNFDFNCWAHRYVAHNLNYHPIPYANHVLFSPSPHTPFLHHPVSDPINITSLRFNPQDAFFHTAFLQSKCLHKTSITVTYN